jgi:hypothetical protein
MELREHVYTEIYFMQDYHERIRYYANLKTPLDIELDSEEDRLFKQYIHEFILFIEKYI